MKKFSVCIISVLIVLSIVQSVVIVTLFKVCREQKRFEQEQKKIYQEEYDGLYSVSLISIIAAPEKYDGKKVRVRGVFRYEYECIALYLSESDYNNCFEKNSITIVVPEKISATEAFALNGKPVILEGTYHKIREGTITLHTGKIDNITRFEEWAL